ncbi:MAG TPA: MFS transporter [Trebonia sp.]|nr:MFS transporter [Trebonia sp.]
MDLGRSLARRFPVLAISDFRCLLGDRLLATSSIGFSTVGVSFAVLNATGSPTDLSYVLAAQIAPTLVFALVGGVLADRISPQVVLVFASLAMMAGEGGFGILALSTRPPLWSMIALEALTGTGSAMIYPASQGLLPRVVPPALLQEASSLSRMGMNTGQMAGAAVSGLVVAAVGPGWSLVASGLCVGGSVPLLLGIKGLASASGAGPAALGAADAGAGLLRELREGWTEFRSHTWLWVTVLQYCLVMMAWNAGFQVLGPVVARLHLGGAPAWGAIAAAEGIGLIAGGVLSLRYTPPRPMLLVAGTGFVFALSPLALGLVAPLAVTCVVSFVIGVMTEVMMVQWTVAMATRIRPGMIGRVASYDAIGSMAAMPAGALVAGPLSAAIGVPSTEYAAAALMAVASAFALLPRDIRTIRSAPGRAPGPASGPAADEVADEVAASPVLPAGGLAAGPVPRPVPGDAALDTML